MALEVGTQLPEATLIKIGADGPEEISLSAWLAGRTVVLFALPGAYTGVCSSAHLPSFMRVADDLREAGVAEIGCLAVNDPFVLEAWGKSSGADAAGITMLGDADASFTKGLGMEFSVPSRGLIDRSNRYALLLEDGVVKVSQIDEPGVCEMSTGEALLEAVRAG
ncbi:MAG: peroxiredoxin [Pseudomonadota bacterium]